MTKLKVRGLKWKKLKVRELVLHFCLFFNHNQKYQICNYFTFGDEVKNHWRKTPNEKTFQGRHTPNKVIFYMKLSYNLKQRYLLPKPIDELTVATHSRFITSEFLIHGSLHKQLVHIYCLFV